jgi:hypothetical protein
VLVHPYCDIVRAVTLTTTDRVQKLKDARSEAAKEIQAYKDSKDKEFKKFESDVSGFLCGLDEG